MVGTPSPGFGVDCGNLGGKRKGPAVRRAFPLFALLFNFTGWDETHLLSKCGGYVAGGVWVGEFSTGLGVDRNFG